MWKEVGTKGVRTVWRKWVGRMDAGTFVCRRKGKEGGGLVGEEEEGVT